MDHYLKNGKNQMEKKLKLGCIGLCRDSYQRYDPGFLRSVAQISLKVMMVPV